ncbi:MAG: sulfide/dihydroorotate dehydrogenase-like FAD/NAD-binding protein [Ignavibacterium sp.]|jgi:ferredoxin--NADP+ reductase
MYQILDKQFLSPTIARFVIRAPFVAPKRKPGNFVIIRLDETGERIPLTIVDADPSEGTIVLIVQGIGKTTRTLLAKARGDTVADVAGPLGTPTHIMENSIVACIGGGVGTAELLPITQALRQAGNKIHTIIGARNRDLVILKEEMAGLSDTLTVTTDDGSYGTKGLVTDALSSMITGGIPFQAVYAIGPLPMMKAVSAVTRPHGIHTVVSLNAIMVDGTGMCGGCRVTVNGTMRFACVDGPEFDGHEVDFDELIMRNRSYLEAERIANQRFEAGAAGGAP